MRCFVDTNVWFSAFYGSENCRNVLRLHATKKVTVVVSREVVTELTKNLGQKFPDGLKLTARFFAAYPPEMVQNVAKVKKQLRRLADKKDTPILAAAVEAEVEYFVTGNLRHFEVEKIQKIFGVQVVSPKTLIGELT